jgi:hypothetical protein
MFYEKKINKPWKLKWNQLAKLYNDDNEEKKVREKEKKTQRILCKIDFKYLERTSFSIGKMSWTI